MVSGMSPRADSLNLEGPLGPVNDTFLYKGCVVRQNAFRWRSIQPGQAPGEIKTPLLHFDQPDRTDGNASRRLTALPQTPSLGIV